MLFAFFILPASLYPEGRKLSAMLLNLSLTQNWGFASPASVNPVAWSLSVELFFYLCSPLLIWRWRQTWAIKLGLTALVTCVGLLYIEHRIHGPLHWPIVNFESASLNPPVRLFEFVLGMATALLFRYVAPRVALRRWQGTLVELSVVGLCGYVMYHSAAWAEQITRTHWNVATDTWAEVVPHTSWIGTTASWWLRSSGLTCLPFAALILVMALERGWMARLLTWSPFVLLGEISYAIYLTHSTILLFWSTHTAELLTIAPRFRYAAYWVAVLLVSYVFWALIEVPCRQAILTRWDRRFPSGRGAATRAAQPTGRPTPRRWHLTLTNPSWRSCVLIVVIGLLVGSSIHSATSPPSLHGYVSYPEAALFQVENIGGYSDEQLGRPIGLPRFAFPSGTVRVTGWAADLERRGPSVASLSPLITLR